MREKLFMDKILVPDYKSLALASKIIEGKQKSRKIFFPIRSLLKFDYSLTKNFLMKPSQFKKTGSVKNKTKST